jgi:hypothetical protein
LRLESHSEPGKPWSGSEKSQSALSETAEKLLSNIGRIPGRQSRQPLLHAADGKSCRRAEKGIAAKAQWFPARAYKSLKYIDIFYG